MREPYDGPEGLLQKVEGDIDLRALAKAALIALPLLAKSSLT